MSTPTAALRPRLPKQGLVRCLAIGTAGITLDVNGIKESIASSASAVTYTGYHFNGVTKVVSGADYGYSFVPQLVTIKTSSHADIDAVACVITGKSAAGADITDTITLPNGGGATTSGTVLFQKVTSVYIPAQSGTGGTVEIGFTSDDNGIKTSIASSASPVTYSDTDFNGAMVSSDDYALAEPPRNVAIKTSSHADIDAVAVKVRGLDADGRPIEDTITLTNGGNTTDQGTKTFARVTEIYIPAQSGTGGALEIGWGSIASFEEFIDQYIQVVADTGWSISCETPGTAITQPDQSVTGDTDAHARCMVYQENVKESFVVERSRAAFKVDAAADSKVLRFCPA